MIKTFQCPNCRASLEHDTDSDTVTCPYCSTTVIVPEELRAKTADTNSSFEVYTDDTMSDLLKISNLSRAGRTQEAADHYQQAFNVSPQEARDAVYYMDQTSSDGGPSCSLLLGLVGLLILAGGAAWAFLVPVNSSISNDAQETIDEIVREVTGGSLETGSSSADPAPAGFADIISSFGGEEGTGPGRFNDTRHLGVDAEGMIYTADYSDGRVQVFQPDGTFETTWNADKDIIEQMAVSRQGVVYMLRGRAVTAYDGTSGEVLYERPLGDSAAGLYANADGGFSVYLNPPTDGDDYVRYDADGNEVERIPNLVSNYDEEFVFFAQHLALDGAGNIYILHSDALLKFGPDGRFQDRISSEGDEAYQFRSPNGMAVDGQGRIYIADIFDMKVYGSEGQFIATIDYPQPGNVIFDMAITDDDQLIGIDRNGNQVLVYQINE